jgi:hypothetical protein
VPTAIQHLAERQLVRARSVGSVRHRFDGHPHLHRILLPRNWTGHPLRKDYPARATEFDPFMLDAAKQDAEQEALLFNPEEWGMKKAHGR